MLSKACLTAAYRTKLEEIAKFSDVSLTVIVPPAWHDPAAPVNLEAGHTNGYRLLVDPIRLNGQYHTYYFPNLKKRLAEIQPDILHIDEEPYNLATWLAMRQGKKAAAKTLFFSWQNLERRYPPPFGLLEKQVLQGVAYAILGNHEAVKVWQHKGYNGPFRVIPQFGIDPEMYPLRPPRDEGRSLVIGSANRRLVPEKGVDLLLRAAARLPGVWRLHIAGEGPERPYLEKLSRELGIQKNVQFDGPIPSCQMPAYLQQLDVLVLASRTLPNWKEQFGRILVEAMACGVAVIGANSGEIPNVIGDAGLTFAENNSNELYAHLLHLLQSPDLQNKLRQKGRQRALSHFTQAEIAAQTVAVYREMMLN